MSHFSVIVITPERPSDDELQSILQPWHEYECTGTDDQYVVDIDETDDYRSRYNNKETTRRYLRDPSGQLHSPYEDRFYRDFTAEEQELVGTAMGTGFSKGISFTSRDWGDGRGYRAKTRFVPDGWTEAEVPVAEAMSFREFIACETDREEVLPGGRSAYGFTEVTSLDPDGEVVRTVDRTNPNARWDWWVLGGRWSGHLRIKAGAAAVRGRPGLMGAQANAGEQYADQALLAEIDIEHMRQAKADEFGGRWDEVRTITEGLPAPLSWESVRQAAKDLDAARKQYRAQPVIDAIRSRWPDHWDIDEELRAYAMSRSDYVQAGRDGALSSFALIKDGQWFERGRMGWWATVHDEKEKESWDREFNQLLDALPPEACLTVVDCHI